MAHILERDHSSSRRSKNVDYKKLPTNESVNMNEKPKDREFIY